MAQRIEIAPVPNQAQERKQNQIVSLHNAFVRLSPDLASVPAPARIEREMRDIAALTRDTQMQELVGGCFSALAGIGDDKQIKYVHEISGVTKRFGALQEAVTQRWQRKPAVLTTMVDTLTHLQDQGQMDPQAVEQTKNIVAAYNQTLKAFHPEVKQPKKPATPETSDSPKKLLKPKSLFNLFAKSGEEITDTTGVHREGAKIQLVAAPDAHVGFMQNIDPLQTSAETQVPTEKGAVEYAVTLLVQEKGVWRKVQIAPAIDEANYDPQKHLPSQKEGLWTADLPKDKARYAIAIQATPWSEDGEKSHKDTSIRATFAESADERKLAAIFHGQMTDHFMKVHDNPDEVRITAWDAKRILIKLEDTDQEDVLNMPLLGETLGTDSFARLGLSFTVRVGALGNKNEVPLQALLYPQTIGQELRQGVNHIDEKDDASVGTMLTQLEKGERAQIIQALGIGPDDTRDVLVYAAAETHTAPEPRMTAGDYVTTQRRTRDIYLQPLAHHESTDANRDHTSKINVVPFVSVSTQERDTADIADVQTFGELLTYIALSDYPNDYKLLPVQVYAPSLRRALEREEALKEQQRQEMMRRFGGGLATRSYGSDLSYAAPIRRGFGDAVTVFGQSTSKGASRVGHSNPVLTLPTTEIGTVAEVKSPKVDKRKRRQPHEKALADL